MKHDVSKSLVDEIRAELERDTRVNMHKSPVYVWFEAGKIVLDGQIDNIAAKRSAVNIAHKLTQGQCPIMDLLRVTPGRNMEDLELRDEVINMLAKEPVFSDYTLVTRVDQHAETVHDALSSSRRIIVNIHNGVVTLSGQVGSLTHKRLAEVLAWWTAGCVAVHNKLEVFPAEEDHDNELTDAVLTVLEKDPMVHASQLHVGTAGGVVELDGFVPSREEKQLAVLDTWYVPGVWDVIDRIKTHR